MIMFGMTAILPAATIGATDGIWDHPYVIDANNTDNYPLMNPYKGHNVALANIEINKTVVGQGSTLRIDVEVVNTGSFPQTFDVTVYANATTIETQMVTLTAGNSTTLRFHWNTTGMSYGNYTISANATQVLGEIDTDDNTLIDGTVFVTIIGDLNCDGIVDASDLSDLSKVYGSDSSKPNPLRTK
jgi:hypothetical protein